MRWLSIGLLFCLISSQTSLGYADSYHYSLKGVDYSLIDACDVYQKKNDGWEFIENICYDKNYRQKYSYKDTNVYFVNEEGRSLLISPVFSYQFDSAKSIKDLLISDPGQMGWTGVTLQSPQAPKVEDYARLEKCLRAGTCEFLDNRVEPSRVQKYSGNHSGRFFSVPPDSTMTTAKASLDTQQIYFKNGDDVWFQAWYYFERGIPSAIMDLESSWLKEYPGPRIRVNKDRSLMIELKALDYPKYRPKNPIPLPMGQWVKIVVHYKLSYDEHGVIELWQNDQKLIDTTGKNIPYPDTILNSLEIGITANPNLQKVVVYVDDVSIGKFPPSIYQ